MALKRLYRIRREHIKVIPKISNYYCAEALHNGYTFIQEEGCKSVYMMYTRTNKKDIEVELLEKVEIVEG